MTNQDILEKAIIKAIDGGWLGGGREVEVDYSSDPYDGERWHVMAWQNDLKSWVFVSQEEIIFNQDFAKALWGEELLPYANIHNVVYKQPIQPDDPIWVEENRVTPAWKSHLQQMVIAEDPIKYLGEHIDDRVDHS